MLFGVTLPWVYSELNFKVVRQNGGNKSHTNIVGSVNRA